MLHAVKCPILCILEKHVLHKKKKNATLSNLEYDSCNDQTVKYFHNLDQEY